ncbi:MAG: hypothetical protein A3J73_07270 [Planctomycetes bacterium RIFCSPHIGHO2_02_FULL_38_41]|nr:MAG: hypothetical protein A3J73_07270 [Planctomycetes bacterium RIFCSPHIGHO2_02_FULL_38_41]OHB97381.1 MAG: hypothetical protein A2W74_06145 [Planctomycetes bacterium RIFCSPLOWO2_12_38_17]
MSLNIPYSVKILRQPKEVKLWQLSNVLHLDARQQKRAGVFLSVVLSVGRGGVAATEQKEINALAVATSI